MNLNNIKQLLILLFLFSRIELCVANDTIQLVEIGKPFPNLTFDDIEYLGKKKASIADFKGKWLILDFWSEYCSSCLASFPKVNSLQNEFRNDVQFLMIGIIRKKKETIKSLYEKLRERHNLQLSVCYDSSIHSSLNIDGLPYVVVLDPEGIVRAITLKVTSAIISDFLKGATPTFIEHPSIESRKSDNYSYKIPYMLRDNGNNQDSFLYRSILSNWHKSVPKHSFIYYNGRFEALGFSLRELYKLAFWGKDTWLPFEPRLYGEVWQDLIFETSDTSLFEPNEATGENLFCYSLVNKRITAKMTDYSNDTLVQQNLQNDLYNHFQLKTRIERREMPCYFLFSDKTTNKNLATKGGPALSESMLGPGQGMTIKNLPPSSIILAVYQSMGFPKKIPVIDNTQIVGNIDITLESLFFDDMVKELSKKGIRLILGTRPQRVLIISTKN